MAKSRDVLRLQAQISGLSGKQLAAVQASASENLSARKRNEVIKAGMDVATGLNDELDKKDFDELTQLVSDLRVQIRNSVRDGDLRGAAFATNSLTSLMKQRDAIGARIAQREAISATKQAQGDDWGSVLGALEGKLENESENSESSGDISSET
jgi:hypothetical protein